MSAGLATHNDEAYIGALAVGYSIRDQATGRSRVLFSDIQGGDEAALIAHVFADFIEKRCAQSHSGQSGIDTRSAASGEQVSLFARVRPANKFAGNAQPIGLTSSCPK
jgi:hypothetical protein